MADLCKLQQARIEAMLEEIDRVYSSQIRDILKEINRTRLMNKAKLTLAPVIEHNSLRWSLLWKEQQKISFELHIVVSVEDNGQTAQVARVWIHRHASTPIDFEGHTPTTRMRRLTILSIDGIREAINAEMA